MNSQQNLREAIVGKIIVDIKTGETDDQNNTVIQSFQTEDGYVIETATGKISHPESETEYEHFFEAIGNVSSAGGLVTFSAKHLSRTIIEKEIKKKALEIGADGWGQVNSMNSGEEITYRFNMPEN